MAVLRLFNHENNNFCVVSMDEEKIIFLRKHTEKPLSSSQDLYIDHPSLEPEHGRFTFTNNMFFLEDTSLTGMLVNGLPMTKGLQYRLRPGDVITIGVDTCSESRVSPLILTVGKNLTQVKLATSSLMQLYNEMPEGDVNIEELWLSWRERHEFVRELMSAIDMPRSISSHLIARMKAFACSSGNSLGQLFVKARCAEPDDPSNFIARDKLSHWILLASSCKRFDTMRWFLKAEEALMRLRWELANSEERKCLFMESDVWSCEVSYGGRYSYVFKYQDVSDLVARREVQLTNGYANTDKVEHLISPIVNYFVEKKRQFLTKIINRNMEFDSNSRLTPVFKKIIKEVRQIADPLSSMKVIPLSRLDEVRRESFPLCMEHLYHYFQATSHLSNFERFQLNLFFKGIGLPLNAAITFWKEGYTKRMSIETFRRKKYEYNIKHNYGAVGRKAIYAPRNCKQLIEDAISGPLGQHGCPFKYQKEPGLKAILSRLNFSVTDIKSILSDVKENRPRAACQRYFEITHQVPSEQEINHPNDYFKYSREIREGAKSRHGKAGNNPLPFSLSAAASVEVKQNEPPSSKRCNNEQASLACPDCRSGDQVVDIEDLC